MSAVLFGALSGALFGALAVAIRTALQKGADPRVGGVVVTGVAVLVSLVGSIPEAAIETVKMGDLWPFALAGALVPGSSQILYIIAVRDAGPSRTSILIGTAPLISVGIALALLGEPVRPLLVVGTLLVVAGGATLVRERTRPEHFRLLGAYLAVVCAGLFAIRDNLVRWGSRDTHPPPLAATTVSLLAAFLVVLVYVLVTRAGLNERLGAALPAFAPAGVALALAYGCLFEAFDSGRVSIVAPLNATQSLWAVVFSVLLFGRSTELIGRRLVIAGVLIVAGAAIIGSVR